MRSIVQADAAEIQQAFDRLSEQSRYERFMKYKKELDDREVQRGVNPRPGLDFVFVATIPAEDSIDIVGAAQYVQGADPARRTCEFAITIAEDWRGIGLGTKLLASLVRRARRDGYSAMEGLVLAENVPMLALARKLKFEVEPVPDDRTVVRVVRTVSGPSGRH